MKIIFSFIMGVSLGFFSSLVLLSLISLDTLAKVAQILTGGSVFIAALAYLYTKKNDKGTALLQQLKFINEKVFPIHEKRVRELQKELPKQFTKNIVNLSPVKEIKNFTPRWLIAHRKKEFLGQLEIHKDLSKIIGDAWSQKYPIELLNALEELAVMILGSNTLTHDSIGALKTAFVKLVEENVFIMINQIASSEDKEDKMYASIIKLYGIWSPQIKERRSSEEIKAYIKEQIKLGEEDKQNGASECA